ncbi:MAG TPA: PQQ-binding-like beta-propeller repeat protein [Chitinophagaceae bacterium]|nr:PQQ-binding-like beta-propeller repeat protein [Chitinophagaceae bacterium]
MKPIISGTHPLPPASQLLLFILLLIIGCSVPHDDLPGPGENNHHALSSFTVSVVDRSAHSAVIEWTESINPYNSDTVKYNISLNSQLVRQNRIQRRDTLYNLSSTTAYDGRVLAFTRSGDTMSAPFYLEKLEGMVVFGEDEPGSRIQCYSLYDYVRVWQSPDFAPEFFDGGVPIIQNDTVFINSQHSGVLALNFSTGQKIWAETSPVYALNSTNTSPIYKNGKIYSTIEYGFHAINSSNGQLIWSYSTTAYGAFIISPVASANYVFTGTASQLIALNINSGTVAWQYSLPAEPCRNPVLYNDLIIFGAADGKVYAINQNTGILVWSRDFSVSYNNLGAHHVAPTIYGNTVILSVGNKGTFALNAFTGATVWNNPSYGGPNITSPTIGGSTVYFAAEGYPDDKICALNAINGQLLWEKTTPAANTNGTAIYSNNRLYVPAYLGIATFDASNGNFLGYIAYLTYSGLQIVVRDHDAVYYPAESGMLQ